MTLRPWLGSENEERGTGGRFLCSIRWTGMGTVDSLGRRYISCAPSALEGLENVGMVLSFSGEVVF